VFEIIISRKTGGSPELETKLLARRRLPSSS